ncbi:MAG: hypothetical protein A2Z34_02215 [Planctomycetes bacterium RBG_16_59_8]|nr:MAG: hypothetical protein A2Z34_02215 [Planctomycetes bacterium RBG_16_59_8]
MRSDFGGYSMGKALLFGAILFSLLLPFPIGAQESMERKFKTPEIVIYYTAKDESGVQERILWVTSDGGATWQKADKDRVAWSENADGKTRVLYRVPSDGRYGFLFQFKDALSNMTPPPQAGDKPRLVAVVETGPEIVPLEMALEIPTKGFSFSSRSLSLRVPYTLKKDRAVGTKTLWVTRDEGTSWEKLSGVEWLESGEARAMVISVKEDGVYGFTLEMSDGKGYLVPAPKPGDAPYFHASFITKFPVVKLEDILTDPAKGSVLTFRKRDIKLTYRPIDGRKATSRKLWITEDTGGTWRAADDAEWLTDAAGNPCVLFSLPRDGAYGVTLELTDDETFSVPAPAAGALPHLVVKVETSAPTLAVTDVIETPKVGQKYTSSSRTVRLPYKLRPGMELSGKELWVTADGGRSWGKANRLEWSTTAEGVTLVRFEAPSDGNYGLAFRFILRDGRATQIPCGLPAHCWVAVATVVASGHPILLKPKGGEEWTGGQVVVLQWMSPNGFKEKSTALSYSVDDGPWTLITKGLENMGFYRWAPPSKATAKLRLRVTMLDGSGKEISSEPSGNIAIRVPASADVASAKRHFYQATLRRAQRKYDESIVSYEKALESWDAYPEALNDIAFVHYEQGDFGKALEYFLRARDVNRGSATASAHVGFALLRLGLAGDALRELETAVAVGISDRRLQGKVSVALLEAARMLAGEGEKEGAARACRLIFDLPAPDPDARRLAEELSKAPGK